MCMRIGLVGAPCVGKTTLAKAVAKKLKLQFIGESLDGALKTCVELDLPVTKASDETFPEYLGRIQRCNSNEIINFGRGFSTFLLEEENRVKDNYITDCASPMHSIGALIYNTFSEHCTSLMHFYNNNIEWAKRYDYIFFIPYNSKIKALNTASRKTNKAVQKMYDLMLPAALACDFGQTSILAILPTSLKERVKFVCDTVTK